MANESELRDRWGDIFRGSAEYQRAKKQAAITKAVKRQELQAAIRNSPNAGFAAELRNRLIESDRTPDPAVQGLDDFQDERFRDYVKKTVARGTQEALTAPVSVAQGTRWRQSRMDPDFREAIPYAEWNPRAEFGISDKDIARSQVRDLDETIGDQWSSPQERLLAARKSSYLSRSYGAESSGLAAQADERVQAMQRDEQRKVKEAEYKKRQLDLDAEEAGATFRGNDIIFQKRLQTEAKDPRLEHFYRNLPDTDKAFMQRVPYEKQIDWLKTHPLWLRSRPASSLPPDRGMSKVRNRETRELEVNPNYKGTPSRARLPASSAEDTNYEASEGWDEAQAWGEPDNAVATQDYDVFSEPTKPSRKESIRRIFEAKEAARRKASGPLFPNAVWNMPKPTSWNAR